GLGARADLEVVVGLGQLQLAEEHPVQLERVVLAGVEAHVGHAAGDARPHHRRHLDDLGARAHHNRDLQSPRTLEWPAILLSKPRSLRVPGTGGQPRRTRGGRKPPGRSIFYRLRKAAPIHGGGSMLSSWLVRAVVLVATALAIPGVDPASAAG